jgi:hypothetical protein
MADKHGLASRGEMAPVFVLKDYPPFAGEEHLIGR